jgi:predicted RNase H-like HicB family nuclease
MKYNFMVSIIKDEDWYVASCLENHVASQGKTRDEALANLQEALELYYEDNDEIPNFEKPFISRASNKDGNNSNA